MQATRMFSSSIGPGLRESYLKIPLKHFCMHGWNHLLLEVMLVSVIHINYGLELLHCGLRLIWCAPAIIPGNRFYW